MPQWKFIRNPNFRVELRNYACMLPNFAKKYFFQTSGIRRVYSQILVREQAKFAENEFFEKGNLIEKLKHRLPPWGVRSI